MDVKNNGKFDLFKGLPRYNTILNWFADMSEDVEREILSLQSKLTPKMIEKCQKGRRFHLPFWRSRSAQYPLTFTLSAPQRISQHNFRAGNP